MKTISTFIFIVLSLLTIQAQDQLSLPDAIRMGLANNYDVQIQRNSEQIAGINNTWGNTSVMPNVNFNTSGRESWNYNDLDNYRSQTIVPDLSLNWVIFNGFSAKINKQKFEELEKQSQGNTVILVESTIQDIILSYNNCLVQRELLYVYESLAKLSEDRYNRTLNSKEIGASTTYESLQAKTSWLEDKSNFLQQRVTFENAVRTLNYLLAVDAETQWNLSSKLEANTPDYSLESLSETLFANNNTLKNQYLYQSLLAKETALAKSTYMPTLSLNTGISTTNFDQRYSGLTPDISQNSTDAYVGVTVSWNIFSGGTRKRSVEIAKINEESAAVQSSQMKHSISNQLAQIYSNYQVQRSLLALAEEKEAAAKLNLELSEEKLKNGSINSFNYRDMQIMYMNAATSKLLAKYNVIQSNTDLLRISGGIINEYDGH